ILYLRLRGAGALGKGWTLRTLSSSIGSYMIDILKSICMVKTTKDTHANRQEPHHRRPDHRREHDRYRDLYAGGAREGQESAYPERHPWRRDNVLGAAPAVQIPEGAF